MTSEELIRAWKNPATSDRDQPGFRHPTDVSLLNEEDLAIFFGGDTLLHGTLACCTTGSGGCTLKNNNTFGCCDMEPGSCN